MCCCVSAAGMALPPAFIFLKVRFASHMLRGAPAGSLGLANPSGWMKHFSSVQFIPISMKRSTTKTTNYKSVKSTFAHGGDSEKTKRSSKSAATALIKFGE